MYHNLDVLKLPFIYLFVYGASVGLSGAVDVSFSSI